MNRIIITSVSLVFLCAIPVWGQETVTKETTNFTVTKDFDEVNAKISIDIAIDSSELGNNTFHHDTLIARAKRSDWPKISIRDIETDEDVNVFGGRDVQIMPDAISFIISDFDKDLLNTLKSREKKHYIFIDKPLKLPLSPKNQDGTAKGGPIAKTLIITPSMMKQKTSGEPIRLSEEEAEALIKARGGEIYMYNNKIDFGVKANISDTTKKEYTLSFAYFHTVKSNFLDWNTILVKGQVGTDKNDPLNRLYIYPINLNLYSSSKILSQIFAQVGVESNQQFTNGRLSANLYWQGIIPNFIDLTEQKNRLRLKPVLKFGIKGFKEFDNTRGGPNELSGEAYAEIYYYIPILDYYSLLLEGNAFYVFSEKITPKRDLRWNY
ncbi:unnamed protein product, partial [marine sediment metagenome]